MKRLLPVLMGFAFLLFNAGEGWSSEPDKDQLCLLGTEHSHSAVLGKCSDAYETGNYETALRDWETLLKREIRLPNSIWVRFTFEDKVIPRTTRLQ